MKRLRTRAAVFALIVFLGLVVDRATKLWALYGLQGGNNVDIIPHMLSLTLVRNPGASFGLGSGATCVISVLAIAACTAMIVAVRKTTSLQWTCALSLAFAGAFGNLIDRATYAEHFLDGKVIDFINYGWSVGNVADIILAIAGVWFVALVVFEFPFKIADASSETTDTQESKSSKETQLSISDSESNK